MKDSRLIPLEEQQQELASAQHETLADETPEGPFQDELKKNTFKVTFEMGQGHSEIMSTEASMKVALGRAFREFKSHLPKRTRIKKVSITIERL